MKKTARKRTKAKAPSHRWADESRTGEQYLIDAARIAGSVAALERACGVCAGHIQKLIHGPERGCLGETARKIRDTTGLPIVAVMLRTAPIKEVIAAELGQEA